MQRIFLANKVLFAGTFLANNSILNLMCRFDICKAFQIPNIHIQKKKKKSKIHHIENIKKRLILQPILPFFLSFSELLNPSGKGNCRVFTKPVSWYNFSPFLTVEVKREGSFKQTFQKIVYNFLVLGFLKFPLLCPLIVNEANKLQKSKQKLLLCKQVI